MQPLSPATPRSPGCKAEGLWEEHIYIAIPANHPAAAQQSIQLDDLRNETFIETAGAAGLEIEDYLVRQLSRDGFRQKISIQHVGRENC